MKIKSISINGKFFKLTISAFDIYDNIDKYKLNYQSQEKVLIIENEEEFYEDVLEFLQEQYFLNFD